MQLLVQNFSWNLFQHSLILTMVAHSWYVSDNKSREEVLNIVPWDDIPLHLQPHWKGQWHRFAFNNVIQSKSDSQTIQHDRGKEGLKRLFICKWQKQVTLGIATFAYPETTFNTMNQYFLDLVWNVEGEMLMFWFNHFQDNVAQKYSYRIINAIPMILASIYVFKILTYGNITCHW